MPPAFTARMAAAIDSISHGRFGVNIISGWQRREYAQMGIWPGADHYHRRYDYCTEYVMIMQELWAAGNSNFKGGFFQMDDCRCLPAPYKPIPIISAGQSDAGTRYAAKNADYNFRGSGGINTPSMVAGSVARLVAANKDLGGHCGALVSTMIIADETDAAALAKWAHYKAGTDVEAIAWRDARQSDDPSRDHHIIERRAFQRPRQRHQQIGFHPTGGIGTAPCLTPAFGSVSFRYEPREMKRSLCHLHLRTAQ